MTKSELQKSILELCAEDYYGVWELYWPYSNAVDKNDIDYDFFISAIKELVDTKKIACFEQNQDTKEFQSATLDLERLRSELMKVKSRNVAWGFYWFSSNEPTSQK